MTPRWSSRATSAGRTIRVDALRLRLTGMDAVAAKRLATAVATGLAAGTGTFEPGAGGRHRVRIVTANTGDRLAETIVGRVCGALRGERGGR